MPVAISSGSGDSLTFMIPAIRAGASPPIGSQASRSDQKPYRWHQAQALSIWSRLK